MRNPIITLIIGLVIGLVVAGGAYAYGQDQGKTQAQNDQTQFLQSRGLGGGGAAGGAGGTGAGGTATGAGGGAARGGGGGNFGTITKIQGGQITMDTAQTPGLTVTTGSNTTVMKTVQGALSDLNIGDRITVQGTRSGTNVAAQQITLVPAGFAFGGGGRNRATPTPTVAP
ncbi:MAG: hypothetical protein ACR2M0_03305 [Chloroflexia bacterium]